jgi:hypothetical protein
MGLTPEQMAKLSSQINDWRTLKAQWQPAYDKWVERLLSEQEAELRERDDAY